MKLGRILGCKGLNSLGRCKSLLVLVVRRSQLGGVGGGGSSGKWVIGGIPSL